MKEGWICPNCGRVWAPWVQCCDCSKGYVEILTTGTPEQPRRHTTGDPIPPDHYNTCGSVESVTKAPEDGMPDLSGLSFTKSGQVVDSNIRERDEKLSQSMTVEELKKWMDVWNGDGNLFNIICDKIKERNEARAKISAP